MGCNADCDGVLPGYVCQNGSSTSPSVCSYTGMCDSFDCVPVCGDGVITGEEICDPGEDLKCTEDCFSVKDGYSCVGGTDKKSSTCYQESSSVKSASKATSAISGTTVGASLLTPSAYLVINTI